MKIQKISIGIGAIGLFTIFIYTWKFFIQSNFTSMWLIGCGVGAGLIFIAYVYTWMKEVDRKVEDVNKRLDAFSNWMFKEEWK